MKFSKIISCQDEDPQLRLVGQWLREKTIPGLRHLDVYQGRPGVRPTAVRPENYAKLQAGGNPTNYWEAANIHIGARETVGLALRHFNHHCTVTIDLNRHPGEFRVTEKILQIIVKLQPWHIVTLDNRLMTVKEFLA